MGEPRSLRPTAPLRLMHTCIVFRRAFISSLVITTEHQLYCLFGWKHKWSALIPYSFIVEPSIVSMNAGKMGPITVSDATLWLHGRARWLRPQTGRKGAIKEHLLSFRNSRSRTGKTFIAVTDNGFTRELFIRAAPLSLIWPSLHYGRHARSIHWWADKGTIVWITYWLFSAI